MGKLRGEPAGTGRPEAVRGEQELPIGLDPDEAAPVLVKPPLRYIAVSVTAREDGSWRASVMWQTFGREVPRYTTLYEGGHPLPDTQEMIQALHSACEELRMRHREERGML